MTDANHERSRQVWWGAAILLVLFAGYASFWWNRGVQLNSNGLGTLASQYILAGKLPYLDFHFWCPPGHILVYTALTALFGDALIYVRAFAAIERLAIYLIVYFWLVRMFSVPAAFFGVAAAGAGLSSDVGDALIHYDFDALLAAVGAGFAASVALTSANPKARWLFFVTGLCAAFSFLAKQTLGVGMALLFPVIFFAYTRRVMPIVEYSLGWLTPVLAVAIWLLRGGAWTAFLNLTFFQATSSKGSLGSIALRPLVESLQSKMLGSALTAALLTTGVLAYLARKNGGTQKTEPQRLMPLAFLTSAAFLLGLMLSYSPLAQDGWVLEQKVMATYSAFAIFLSMISSGAIALYFTIPGLRGMLNKDEVQKWVCASLSFIIAYMFSLSWAAYEPMLVPGLAFLIAWVIGSRGSVRSWRGPVLATVALASLLITTAVVRKMTWPYTWKNWSDGPIKTETVETSYPVLRGIRVAPNVAAFLKNVTDAVDAHSRPGDTIFCFPNFALFHVLANRPPATFAFSHWYDIVSDAVCLQDADRIRAHPPAVILMTDISESDIRREERVFRGGKRSGQRDLIDTIRSMPGYRVLKTVEIPNIEDGRLNIYVRD